jgi:photosystem II stability/assembly factor-like uncharacterized protein
MCFRPAYFALLALLIVGSAITKPSVAAKPAPAPPTEAALSGRALSLYRGRPLAFEVNQGQADPAVRFQVRGAGYGLFLTEEGPVFSVASRSTEIRTGSKIPGPRRSRVEREPRHVHTAAVRMRLLGARKRTQIHGLDPLPGRVNYLVGNDPSKWTTNVRTCARVRYEGVYPGVDVEYHGRQGSLEHDFLVAPGADPDRIRLAFEGAREVALTPDGDLELRTAAGTVVQRKPVAYQEIGGQRVLVPVRFRVGALGVEPGAIGSDPRSVQTASGMKGSVLRPNAQRSTPTRIGFEVAAYDKTRPLTIDPILIFSTYVGGSTSSGAKPRASGLTEVDEHHLEAASDVAVDPAGNAYLTGFTVSSDYYTTPGVVQPGYAGGQMDAFVTKINAAGSALVYSTFLGGGHPSGDRVWDLAKSISVDASGSAYVAGYTNSIDFPTTASARQSAHRGEGDAFISRLDPSGAVLVYSSFLGGSRLDAATAVTADDAGAAYVTGITYSDNFPTRNPLQPHNQASDGANAFVSKVDTGRSGTASLVYSTYLGGSGGKSGADGGGGIVVDAAGSAYVAGGTGSADFPVVAPLQPHLAGSTDAFLAKLSPSGTALQFSTYLGGESYEDVLDLGIGPTGDLYLFGGTHSVGFPTTTGAFQELPAGDDDAFVARVDPAGSQLRYSTRVGGSGRETLAFATQFIYGEANPSFLLERGGGISIDGAGSAWITGPTWSFDFPTTPDALAQQTTAPSLLKTTNAAGSWSRTDQGLPGDNVLGLAFDPSTPATVYAATEQHGIYRSSDAGVHWSPLESIPGQLPIEQVLVSPASSSILYAVPSSDHDAEGFFRSLDGGATWQAATVGLPLDDVDSNVVIDPAVPSTLYAGTFRGVYKSINGGATWLAANRGTERESVLALAIDAQNPQTLFAGGLDGLFRTSNGGKSWVELTAGLPGSSRTDRFTPLVGVDPKSSGTVFAYRAARLFRSQNGGQSWQQVGEGLFGLNQLVIDPVTPGVLYAGTLQGVYKSVDQGATWSPALIGLGFRQIQALAVDPADASRLYAAPVHESDAFIAKLNVTGTALLHATYLGGSELEDLFGAGIAVDAVGAAYITGVTSSPDFPTQQPLQPGLRGDLDAFLVKLADPGETLPADPDGLTATAVGAAVALSWTDHSTNEGAFLIERRTGDGGWAQVGAVRAGRTSFTDRTAPAGALSTYRVHALNPKGLSSYSNEATVTPGPGGGRLTVTPKKGVSFGTVKGARSQERTVHLKNSGPGSLWVQVGPPEAPFSVTMGSGARSLASGETLRVGLRFAPAKKGTFNGALPVQTDTQTQPEVLVPLSGRRR